MNHGQDDRVTMTTPQIRIFSLEPWVCPVSSKTHDPQMHDPNPGSISNDVCTEAANSDHQQVRNPGFECWSHWAWWSIRILELIRTHTFIKIVERLISHSFGAGTLSTISGCPRTVRDSLSAKYTVFYDSVANLSASVLLPQSWPWFHFWPWPQNGLEIVALASLEPTFLMWYMLNNEVPVQEVLRNWTYVLAKKRTGIFPFPF